MPYMTDDEWEDVLNSGQGFVFNDFARNGASGIQNNILHRAACNYLRAASPSVPKMFFHTWQEAVEWLNTHRAGNWKVCGACCKDIERGIPARAIPARKLARCTADGPSAEVIQESRVQRWLVQHLEAKGYEVTEGLGVPSGILDVFARGDAEQLVIEVKGEDKGGYTSTQMNFQIGSGQILSRMSDSAAVYAVAFPSTPSFLRVLRTYRNTHGFEKAGISAFVVALDGTVTRYAPTDFQKFINGVA